MQETLCACGCGEVITPKRHHKWKPAKYISGHNARGKGLGWRINHGYRQCIRKGSNYWKYEQVIVMEEHLKRLIKSDEVVHHKNGNKTDNRLKNLELMKRSDHMKLHDKERKRDNLGRFSSEKGGVT